MSLRTKIWILPFLSILPHAWQIQAAPLTNGDFETGDLSFWTITSGGG